MYVSFNTALLDGKGNETPQKISDILSDLLLTETKGATRKLYGWGLLLANGNEIFLDEADKKTLTDLVENTDRIIVLAKGQILNVLDNAKEEKKVKEA